MIRLLKIIIPLILLIILLEACSIGHDPQKAYFGLRDILDSLEVENFGLKHKARINLKCKEQKRDFRSFEVDSESIWLEVKERERNLSPYCISSVEFEINTGIFRLVEYEFDRPDQAHEFLECEKFLDSVGYYHSEGSRQKVPVRYYFTYYQAQNKVFNIDTYRDFGKNWFINWFENTFPVDKTSKFVVDDE
ncbi:MAG: hypothetical protein H6581_31040 [Bacteroidia bacterium]|nr:hypothetical protein [Bacteroidia bacterium]